MALAGPVYQLSWSPDGSELLLVDSYGVHVVGADGAGLRTLAYSQRGTHRWSGNFEGKGSAMGMAQAAWSPDGSRIAVYDSGDLPLWGQYSDTVDASHTNGVARRDDGARPGRMDRGGPTGGVWS